MVLCFQMKYLFSLFLITLSFSLSASPQRLDVLFKSEQILIGIWSLLLHKFLLLYILNKIININILPVLLASWMLVRLNLSSLSF